MAVRTLTCPACLHRARAIFALVQNVYNGGRHRDHQHRVQEPGQRGDAEIIRAQSVVKIAVGEIDNQRDAVDVHRVLFGVRRRLAGRTDQNRAQAELADRPRKLEERVYERALPRSYRSSRRYHRSYVNGSSASTPAAFSA